MAEHFNTPTKNCYEHGCTDDCPVAKEAREMKINLICIRGHHIATGTRCYICGEQALTIEGRTVRVELPKAKTVKKPNVLVRALDFIMRLWS